MPLGACVNVGIYSPCVPFATEDLSLKGARPNAQMIHRFILVVNRYCAQSSIHANRRMKTDYLNI
jgi:hypothetical protein